MGFCIQYHWCFCIFRNIQWWSLPLEPSERTKCPLQQTIKFIQQKSHFEKKNALHTQYDVKSVQHAAKKSKTEERERDNKITIIMKFALLQH